MASQTRVGGVIEGGSLRTVRAVLWRKKVFFAKKKFWEVGFFGFFDAEAEKAVMRLGC